MTAPDGSPPAAFSTEVELDAYGWQLLLADAASVGLVFSHDRNLATIGLLGYVLAGPILHGAHDQGNRIVASVGLRVGLPLVSAVGLAALADARSHCAPSDDDCDTGAAFAAVFGLGLGAVTAMVLDDALVAGPAKVRRTTAMTWVPQIAATPQRVALGVLGRF